MFLTIVLEAIGAAIGFVCIVIVTAAKTMLILEGAVKLAALVPVTVNVIVTDYPSVGFAPPAYFITNIARVSEEVFLTVKIFIIVSITIKGLPAKFGTIVISSTGKQLKKSNTIGRV